MVQEGSLCLQILAQSPDNRPPALLTDHVLKLAA